MAAARLAHSVPSLLAKRDTRAKGTATRIHFRIRPLTDSSPPRDLIQVRVAGFAHGLYGSAVPEAVGNALGDPASYVQGLSEIARVEG